MTGAVAGVFADKGPESVPGTPFAEGEEEAAHDATGLQLKRSRSMLQTARERLGEQAVKASEDSERLRAWFAMREHALREETAKAQAAASESKSQFVVVRTTLQGSAVISATGSCVAARSAVLHFGLGARKPPAVRASSSAATRRRPRILLQLLPSCLLFGASLLLATAVQRRRT